jgi:hypothetical protein
LGERRTATRASGDGRNARGKQNPSRKRPSGRG